MWTYSNIAIPAPCLVCETLSLQGCSCLWNRLIRSHHPLEVPVPSGPPPWTVPSEADLLQHGLTHSHSPSQNRPAPTWPHPWMQALQGCSCSVVRLSMDTFFEVLQHNLVHSHWCYNEHLLQHGSSTTTGDSKCTFYTSSCMDLSLGHNPFRGTPRMQSVSSTGMPPSTQVDTGIPACPGEQHRTRSDALASPGPSPLLPSKCSQAQHFSKDWSLMNAGL